MRIAYTRPDGGVSIVTASTKDSLEKVLGPLTVVEYKNHVIARSVPSDATDVAELPDDWPPPDTDRTFRDAWRHVSGNFHVDMPAARDIHRNRIRNARGRKLLALDVEYNKADEAGDMAKKRDIAQQKQVLRDMPANPAIELAGTVDELRQAWPQDL